MSGAAPALELWLPSLGRFAPDHPLRGLLAHADRLADGARGYMGGLQAHFQCDIQPLPAAALLRQRQAGDAADACWLSADPCWVQAEMNGARLLACGQLGLSREEAEALAQPLRPVFGDAGMLLEVSAPDRWQLRLAPGAAIPAFSAPEQALGEDLFRHLPQGPQGRRWRVLLNEIQVVLHQHPLNAQRRMQGLPPVNSLWLWGGGTLPMRVTSAWTRVISDDPLLDALAHRAGIERLERTEQNVAAAVGATLVDLQDLPVSAIEQAWWPTLATLARGGPVRWSFASGERWLSKPWHRLRFWRRGGAG